jgi:hypothetical protein
MTTQTANGSAPQIDARALRAARKRTFTAAGKACKALLEDLTTHDAELAAGHVPPEAALAKQAGKYLSLLATLDTMDALLTPEVLEAIYGEHEAPGQVSVSREDLALLTGVITSMHPEVPADDRTPLGRLTAAAHPGGLGPSQLAETAAAVSIPAGS